MKLQDLKNVISFSFDLADDEIDATVYIELSAINEKYAKKIEVVKISHNYVVCKFTDFFRKNKTAIKKYLLDNYNKGERLKWLMENLVYVDDITASEDNAEAIWYFMKYDLEDFLTQE